MNKTIYLLLLIFALKTSLPAQTPIWENNINSSLGWVFEDNWEWSTSGFVYLTGGPITLNFDMSVVSPVFHINDMSEELIISQHIEVSQTGGITTEMAEISLVVDGEDVVVWDWELINGDWGVPSDGDLVLPIGDYVGQDVQVKFRSFGPTSDAWSVWSIYNMRLSATFDYDLCAHEISGFHYIDINETDSWRVEIDNYGQYGQSDYIVELINVKSGEILSSTTVTNTLEPGETAVHYLHWTPEEAENTALYANVVSATDDFMLNDSSNSFFLRINSDTDYNILVWDNDNNINTILDPEKHVLIQPSDALIYILNYTGFSYTVCSELPDNINDYNIILGTMGCYCLS